MAIERLMRATRTVLVMPTVDINNVPHVVGADGSTTPFETPSAAVLNSWIGITSMSNPASHHGGNISCALLDDLELGTTDSETDDELTICSRGNESEAVSRNVSATMTVFRDKFKANEDIFNLATHLFNAENVNYAILDRVGYVQNAPIVSGQDVSLYEVTTNNPVDVKEDQGNLKITQSPAPTGILLTNHTLA